MTTKEEVLECSIANFTKFGSKSFTMDELAGELGMSKKTIYNYFKNKEDLVSESLEFLIKKIKKQIDLTLLQHTDPIVKIIEIYKIGFDYFKCFKPSFTFGLKKYYPKADEVFETFRHEIVFGKVYNLLEQAQQQKLIKEEINIKLACELYFLRIENVIYKPNNFFDEYSKKELLEHMIVYNLKGISNANYTNSYFE
ncbi:TetR/AcrR family transcriptional regulator [Gaetbulibacter sp. M235]|uniref:TetR/AcrR family transcriptional regulator n=1 Tax=Gaetbulibacter sp. M235 TaxID=3126510 RepID=UPI00374F0EC0